MPHGFGPVGANAATTRPANPSDPYNVQTWFKNASAPGAKDGTVIDQSFLNALVAERLDLAAASGVEPAGNLGNDTFLTTAITALVAARLEQLLSPEFVVSLVDLALAGTNWRELYPQGSDTAVQFNDNGQLSGAASLFWTPINGRLGLGTAAPTTAFHSTGPVRVGQFATADLPSAATVGAGTIAFDTTLVKLVVSNGATWIAQT
jgi:hypothetical protein